MTSVETRKMKREDATNQNVMMNPHGNKKQALMAHQATTLNLNPNNSNSTAALTNCNHSNHVNHTPLNSGCNQQLAITSATATLTNGKASLKGTNAKVGNSQQQRQQPGAALSSSHQHHLKNGLAATGASGSLSNDLPYRPSQDDLRMSPLSVQLQNVQAATAAESQPYSQTQIQSQLSQSQSLSQNNKDSQSQYLQSQSEIRSIDSIENSDPKECSEYIGDIIDHLRNLERRKRPRANYMSKQRDINSNMRSILVDWLVEVTLEFKLTTETVYLTVNLVDRFLSLMHVTRSKLQLVGVAAMLIASKLEELYPPLVEDFVYICDGTYRAEEVRLMEFQILRVLQFDTSFASTSTFCARFIKAANGTKVAHHLAEFLCELTLQDYYFLKYIPSEIAASAVVLALYTLDLPYWDATMRHYFGFELDELLKDCIPSLFILFKHAPESHLQSIRGKYMTPQNSQASAIRPKSSLPVFIKC